VDESIQSSRTDESDAALKEDSPKKASSGVKARGTRRQHAFLLERGELQIIAAELGIQGPYPARIDNVQKKKEVNSRYAALRAYAATLRDRGRGRNFEDLVRSILFFALLWF
jgi:hypothetical protein